MNALEPYMLWIKLAAIALLIAAASFATWYATSDHYEKQMAQQENKWQQAYIASAEMQAAALVAEINKRTNAEAQHAKDQLAINSLTQQLGGVRIHIPTGCGQAGKSSVTGQGANGGGGVFPERVDAAFAELQAGVGRLIQRCDQINIDAIKLNSEVGQ